MNEARVASWRNGASAMVSCGSGSAAARAPSSRRQPRAGDGDVRAAVRGLRRSANHRRATDDPPRPRQSPSSLDRNRSGMRFTGGSPRFRCVAYRSVPVHAWGNGAGVRRRLPSPAGSYSWDRPEIAPGDCGLRIEPKTSCFQCGADGNRTRDLLHAMQALSHLSYSPGNRDGANTEAR
jgi:hypothetical protein